MVSSTIYRLGRSDLELIGLGPPSPTNVEDNCISAHLDRIATGVGIKAMGEGKNGFYV